MSTMIESPWKTELLAAPLRGLPRRHAGRRDRLRRRRRADARRRRRRARRPVRGDVHARRDRLRRRGRGARPRRRADYDRAARRRPRRRPLVSSASPPSSDAHTARQGRRRAPPRARGGDPERGLDPRRGSGAARPRGPEPARPPRAAAVPELAWRQLPRPARRATRRRRRRLGAIGETLEAAAIAAIVVLNGALGFSQEAGAQRAVLALRERFRRSTRVVRGGGVVTIPTEDVVVGDLLALREGESVAADARVVTSTGLDVDESALTGSRSRSEAGGPRRAPRPRSATARPWSMPGPRSSAATGTRSSSRPGSTTELGRIALLAETARRPPTPLQRRTATLARALAIGGALLTVALTAAMLARGESAEDAFLLAVAVAVAAVPEGLLATVTIALALGRTRDGRPRRDRQPARRGRDARGDHRRLLRQDRDADPEPPHARALLPAPRRVRSVVEAAVLASATTRSTSRSSRARGARRRPRAPGAGRRLVRETPLDPTRRRMSIASTTTAPGQDVREGRAEVLLAPRRRAAR